MKISTFIIDTFTATRFKGNPTAVCYLDTTLNTTVMQSVAAELNLPVTAFIKKDTREKQLYDIQYFTVTTEIPACGHATLGAAFVVMEKDNPDEVTFRTAGGVTINTVLKDGFVTMTYPRYEMKPYTVSEAILESLHIGQYEMAGYCTELETVFIELNDPAELRKIQPDFTKMLAVNNAGKEIVVTAVSDIANYDFLLRSFCPWIGINEDPVTGSVHTVLAGFWQNKLKKNRLKAYQASERGGELTVISYEDKVELGGQCVMLFKGELNVD